LAGAKIITLVFVSVAVFTQVSILPPAPQFHFQVLFKNSAKVKLITFTLCSVRLNQFTCACFLGRPVTSLSVTGPGWLNLAQPKKNKNKNRKRVKKRKRCRKFVFSSLKIQNFTKLFTNTKLRSIVFFGFMRYLPTLELKIFVGNFSLTPESEI